MAATIAGTLDGWTMASSGRSIAGQSGSRRQAIGLLAAHKVPHADLIERPQAAEFARPGNVAPLGMVTDCSGREAEDRGDGRNADSFGQPWLGLLSLAHRFTPALLVGHADRMIVPWAMAKSTRFPRTHARHTTIRMGGITL
jgi:hypothetical protein